MAQLISVGEILDKSWHYYKKHFTDFMSISGWLLISVAISIIGFALFPSASAMFSERAFTGTENIGKIILALNTYIITPLLGVWILNGVIGLIKAHATNKTTTLKEVARDAWKYFWPAVLVTILFTLVMVATLLFIAPGFVLISIGVGLPSGGGAISVIGSLLLIAGVLIGAIFALIWGVRFFFFLFALIVDNFHGRAALKESYRLTSGKFWPVLIRLVIPKILYFVIFAGVLFVLLSISDVIIAGVSGLNIDLQVRLYTIVTLILVSIQTILINPLIAISDYLIYKSLREQK